MKNNIKKRLEGYSTFEKMMVLAVAAILLIGVIALSYGTTALLIYGICWCFSLQFSFKLALGVWLLLLAINMLIKK